MASVNSQTGAIKRLEKNYEKIKNDCDKLKIKQSQNELVDKGTINRLRNQIKQFGNTFISDVKELDSVNDSVYNRAYKIIHNMYQLVDDLIVGNAKIAGNQNDTTQVILKNLKDCIEKDGYSIKAKNVDEADILDILLEGVTSCLDGYNNGSIDKEEAQELINYVIEELDDTFSYSVSENNKKEQASKNNINKQQKNKNNQNEVAITLETIIGYIEEDYDLIKSNNASNEEVLKNLLQALKDCLRDYNDGKLKDEDVMLLIDVVVTNLGNYFNYNLLEKDNEKQTKNMQQNGNNHTNPSAGSQNSHETNNRTNTTSSNKKGDKKKNNEARKRYKVKNVKRSGLALGGVALGIWGVRRVVSTFSLMINWGIDLVSIPQLGITASLLLMSGSLLKKAFFYRDKKIIKKSMEKINGKKQDNKQEENKGRRGRR